MCVDGVGIVGVGGVWWCGCGGYDGVYVRSAGAWVVGVGMVEWFG